MAYEFHSVAQWIHIQPVARIPIPAAMMLLDSPQSLTQRLTAHRSPTRVIGLRSRMLEDPADVGGHTGHYLQRVLLTRE